MRYLLDSNILIGFLNGDKKIIERFCQFNLISRLFFY